MEKSENIFRLEGSVQHYDWGGKTFLPQLLHLANDDRKPFAEYWLGAHLKSPAHVIFGDGHRLPLNDLIATDPGKWLGARVAKDFGVLPYLLKAQDVRLMLSIQVHPSKEVAAKKFQEENEQGIALEAAHRNYKDTNHKPELLSPLSDFYLLHGFKSPDKIRSILSSTPELKFLEEYFGNDDYRKIYTHVMTMPQPEVDRVLEPLVHRITPLYDAGVLEKGTEDFWAARAAHTFSVNGHRDRGIFSIYLFNIVRLSEGDALFQDAGLPHAYLEGHTMEIMANSDNVLRGGLTPKHIDVNELLQHIRFAETIPAVIASKPFVNGEEVFKTVAKDFQLSKIGLGKGAKFLWTTQSAEIVFVYDGQVSLTENGLGMTRTSGKAAFLAAGLDVTLSAIEDAIVFRASVPE
jgi:mannose-6-phosphate isomerase